jgi:LacI family transcriptional regulator
MSRKKDKRSNQTSGMEEMTESPGIDLGRPTLKTIAAQTGLAIATVSRALKDAPDIGEATKLRVRETALRLGYRPNRAGVRLRTGKTNVIALVLSTEADIMNHTSRLIYSIAAELRGTPYHLVVMPYFPDEDPMTPIRYIVETESADAIIMNQTTAHDPRVVYMAAQGFPFATHGRTSLDIDHPFFDYDNEMFSRIAVRALAARKHRNLLLIAPPREQNYSRHMVTGFLSECAALGLNAEILDSADSDSGADRIEEEMAQRFATHPAPDALVVGSTTAAMASVTGAERAGFQIGVDFDVVAKEAISFLKRFRKEIIVSREDVNHAGRFLARAVIAAIERRAPEQGQFVETPTEANLG